MKKSLQAFLILFITSASFCFGQQKKEFGVNFSMSEAVKGGGIGQGLIGFDGKYTYTMGGKGFVLYTLPIGVKFIINKWDEKMNLVSAEKIPMKTDEYKLSLFTPNAMHLVGDKFIHVMSCTNRPSKTEEVFLVEYDKTTFKIKEKRKIASSRYGNEKRSSDVYFLEDKDNPSEFGIVSLVQKGEVTEVYFFVLDSEMNFNLERNFKFNKGANDIKFSDFAIHGDNIFLVVAEEDDNGSIEKLTFHMYSKSTDNHLQIPLEIQGKVNNISDFKVTKNDEGKLSVSGFYEANENVVIGSFTQLYDLRKGTLLNQDVSPFDFDFITSSLSEKGKKSAMKSRSEGESFNPCDYYVRDVITNDDGSSIVVGECYNQYTIHQDGGGRPFSTTFYQHGDIILTRTNKNGEIEWVKKHFRDFESKNTLDGKFLVKDRNQESFNIIYSTGGLSIVDVNKHDGSSNIKSIYSKDEIGEKLKLLMTNPLIAGDNKTLIQAVRLNTVKVITMEFDAK